jgi:hypothetical protein
VVAGTLNGERFSWTISTTPSGPQAVKKMIADLRRELRRCHVEEVPQFALLHYTAHDPFEGLWEVIWEGDSLVRAPG